MEHLIINNIIDTYPTGDDPPSLIKYAEEAAEIFIKHNKYKRPCNIWCRGGSGALIAGIFSYILFKNNYACKICHVKKPNEQSHQCSYYSYRHSIALQIIIDDFMSSGKTLNAIYKDMQNIKVNKVDYLIISSGYNEKSLKFEPDVLIHKEFLKNNYSS